MITRYLSLALFICGISAFAQPSLESLVSEAKAEWMFGNWQGQTENGDSVTLGISWDLDKHVIMLHFKGAEMEAKGYTVLEPKSEQPKYYSFDNRGSVGKGSWNMQGGDLVLRVDSETADRGTRKGAFVFSGSSGSGLQVSMHSVESSGELTTPARFTIKFKKQK